MIKNLKIRTKLIVLSFVSLAIALFLGITSIFKLENTNEGLKGVYHDRVLPLVQLKNIAEAYAVNIVDTAVKLRNDKISFEKCVSNINEAKTIIDKNWNEYLATNLDDKEKEIVKNILKLRFHSLWIKLYKDLDTFKYLALYNSTLK